jgi:hypothetical protein
LNFAVDLLFNVYKQQRSEWVAALAADTSSNSNTAAFAAAAGPYLVHQGTIPDPARLEVFVKAIGSVEMDILTEREKNNAEYVRFFFPFFACISSILVSIVIWSMVALFMLSCTQLFFFALSMLFFLFCRLRKRDDGTSVMANKISDQAMRKSRRRNFKNNRRTWK